MAMKLWEKLKKDPAASLCGALGTGWSAPSVCPREKVSQWSPWQTVDQEAHNTSGLATT